ncbi:MAG: hypothetical protein Q9199_002974 [Rusavskia elegans]
MRSYSYKILAIAWCKSLIVEHTIQSGRKAYLEDIIVTSHREGVTKVFMENSHCFAVVKTPFTRLIAASAKTKSQDIHIVYEQKSGELLRATDSPKEANRIRESAIPLPPRTIEYPTFVYTYVGQQYECKKTLLILY